MTPNGREELWDRRRNRWIFLRRAIAVMSGRTRGRNAYFALGIRYDRSQERIRHVYESTLRRLGMTQIMSRRPASPMARQMLRLALIQERL